MALTLIERARLYIDKVEAPRRAKSDPQDSHALVFSVAQALVNGFELPLDAASSVLREFCSRGDGGWSEAEIAYKIRQAEAVPPSKPRGWLRGDGRAEVGVAGVSREVMPVVEKPSFSVDALRKFAGVLESEVNAVWLGNRSAVDPAGLSADDFLGVLYNRKKEKVVVFTEQWSQGDAVWPDDVLPSGGKDGVWFMCQPVDGKFYPNPRAGKRSRRSAESVLAWRYMVLESDEAPMRLWLGALARMPLPIAAIYSSGKRSVHALIRVDAGTKEAWDGMKRELAPALVTLGGDPGALSAVRLTRLPRCMRGGRLQKLLYVNPDPDRLPLAERFQVRDVCGVWLERAEAEGLTDEVRDGLGHYAPVVWSFKELLK